MNIDYIESATKDGPTIYRWVGDAKSYGRAVDAEPVGSKEFAARIKKIAAKLKPDEDGLVLISRIYDAYARAFSDAGPLKAWKVRIINAKVDGYLELHPSSGSTTMTDSERERSRVILGESGFFYFIHIGSKAPKKPKQPTKQQRFVNAIHMVMAKANDTRLAISTAFQLVHHFFPEVAKDIKDFKSKLAIVYKKGMIVLETGTNLPDGTYNNSIMKVDGFGAIFTVVRMKY